ncbi:E7 protein [Bos taurus papillomavirus 11]|uniref:Protein E7 n=1 Tax=Bos taurus papillomavirus 11 TaxID=714200 RepID=E1CGB8_9PAPI|nr:E7 protein [Bos taurus papillomavirus 11]
MKGPNVTLEGIAADLENAVSPINLNCEEEIDTEEVELPNPFEITATCYVCEKILRLAVVTSNDGIHQLQQLLFENLSLLCSACSRDVFCNRRPVKNGP